MKNPQKIAISVLILAGGQSSRMGQDKALLNIQDRPLLTHVCTVAQNCVNRVYVITPWTYKYQNLLPSSVILIKENIILTNTKSNCPLVGFYQGLQYINADWILLLACDLPLLNSATIKQWCQYLPKVRETEIALLPRGVKGWEPLSGFYRRRCLPLIQTYLNQGGKSFQKWLAQYPIKELPVSDRSVLFNCNTWQDWQKIHN